MDSGYYEVVVWNACGDTARNSITANNQLTVQNTNSVAYPGCGLGDGYILMTNDFYPVSPIFYQVFDANNSVMIDNRNDSGAIYNLDTGTYHILYFHVESWCVLSETQYTLDPMYSQK